MVCMALSHRINQTRSDQCSQLLAEKFYIYWGLALRSLGEHVLDHTRRGDTVIAGII
ncbi:hypothetical protein QBC46DRAFT_395166 [Diplogelasinospora grovesii]|uniref:Uncharacterized protein n=1 Tax=Diplogelasinospora grovesii TaxID=303347 RepID=A0AAN6N0P0_9PEZI|nr:hypothetical protein QBC46DRAFT_395166 [Diplogelasinospora grovesii]